MNKQLTEGRIKKGIQGYCSRQKEIGNMKL